MLPHGPDADGFDKATKAELKPRSSTTRMAFMFETRFPQHLTRFAAELETLQEDYADCWGRWRRTSRGPNNLLNRPAPSPAPNPSNPVVSLSTRPFDVAVLREAQDEGGVRGLQAEGRLAQARPRVDSMKLSMACSAICSQASTAPCGRR